LDPTVERPTSANRRSRAGIGSTHGGGRAGSIGDPDSDLESRRLNPDHTLSVGHRHAVGRRSDGNFTHGGRHHDLRRGGDSAGTCCSQTPRKSPKEKRKKKKKSATRESEGQFVIRLKTPGSAQPVAAVEEEGRPGSMAEILTATVHSAENGEVLAAEASSVQIEVFVKPVQSTNEL
jgi:hypothetical protein